MKKKIEMTDDKLFWDFRVQAWGDKKNYIIKITGNKTGVEGVITGDNLIAALLRLIKRMTDKIKQERSKV